MRSRFVQNDKGFGLTHCSLFSFAFRAPFAIVFESEPNNIMRTLILSVLLFSCIASAQECTTHVVVNVYEPKIGLDVETLTAADFDASLEHHRTPLTVTGASQNYTSRLLVLLETDEAAKKPEIGEVIDTVTRLARQAPEGEPVAFGVFADRAVFTKGFFPDAAERAKAINAVREEADAVGKRVAMYDSLLAAVKLFGPHQPGDTLLLVAGAYDDKSSHSSGAVEQAVRAAGVRFMVMLREPLSAVAHADFLTNSHEIEKKMYTDLSLSTGGAYTDFDPHFFSFAWRGYMLDIKATEGRRGGPAKWKLRLTGEKADKLRKAKIYVPQLLPPCEKTTS